MTPFLLIRTLLLGGMLISLSCSTLRAEDTDKMDTHPVPVKTPPPVYPVDLRRKSIGGLVTVRVVIDEQGNVADCAVKKSSRMEFEDPAIAAVKQWKFKPAMKDGMPVRCHMLVPINFNVN